MKIAAKKKPEKFAPLQTVGNSASNVDLNVQNVSLKSHF
jgi:hypothetical protein